MQTGRNVMIGVLIRREDKELLKKVCAARGEDISDFVRRAIYKELAALSFLPDDVKKALGLQERNNTLL